MKKVILKEIPDTVVNVKTQKEYDELMKIYEKAGWRWEDGSKPTKVVVWKVNKNRTCIEAKNQFACGEIEMYQRLGYDVISFSTFKKIQGIKGKRGRPKKKKTEENPEKLNNVVLFPSGMTVTVAKREKVYVLQLEKNRKIKVVITEDKDGKHISIQDYKGAEKFVFSNTLTEETLDKWEEVISLISKAIEIARKEL